MRQIAKSSTVEECESRLEALQASPNWSRKESHNFRQWFTNTWLSEKEVRIGYNDVTVPLSTCYCLVIVYRVILI